MYGTELSFRPKWATPPGSTIDDILKERAVPIEKFAAAIGESPMQVNELLRGNFAIDQTLAGRLGSFFGTSDRFWVAREAQYRQDLARLGTSDNSKDFVTHCMKTLPIKEMTEFGWIPKCSEAAERADEALRFFSIPSFQHWQSALTQTLKGAAFRKTSTFSSHEVAAATWLRQGERQAEQIDCGKWDTEGFSSQLALIRTLTRQKDPHLFIPKLQELCAVSGVAFVIVRAPSGCRASGATKFIAPNKALMMLSFRYLSDDHFWFTFFHEAAHLLLHNHELIFFEGEQIYGKRLEDEANLFSGKCLIPEEFEKEMCSLPRNFRAILRFAKKIGVSPGVVVGQLQFRGIFSHSEMNHLKNRFRWG